MSERMTKQGVRDLGGVVPRRQRVVYACPHVWEVAVDWDQYPEPVCYERCGLCKETRR